MYLFMGMKHGSQSQKKHQKGKIHFNQIEALGAPLAYRRPGAQTIGVLNPLNLVTLLSI